MYHNREVPKEGRSRMAQPTVGSGGASGGIRRRGAWSKEEDSLLRKCVETYGEGNWHLVPQRAGIKRCRKSCRLRWLNYLSPNIKRGRFSSDEEDLIMRMHCLLGNKWSLIAGRIPGRTANDVKNHWNSHLAKRVSAKPATGKIPATPPRTIVYKPEAQRVSMRMREFLREMCSRRDQRSLNPPSSSLPLDGAKKPLDGARMADPAPEPSSSNLQWSPEKIADLEGDWFLDIPEPDDLFCDSLFLWDWTKDDNGSSPLR